MNCQGVQETCGITLALETSLASALDMESREFIRILMTFLARYTARYCDTIAAIPPYSAIPFRGQLDVRYPPYLVLYAKQMSMR